MTLTKKKIAFGALVAVTAIAVPVATVVSCGSKKSTDKKGSSTSNVSTSARTKAAYQPKAIQAAVGTVGYAIHADDYAQFVTPKLNSANKDAIATAFRESGSTAGKYYNNDIFPSTFKGTMGKYSIQLATPEADKLVTEALKNKEELILSSAAGLKAVAGKVVLAGKSHGKDLFIITEKGRDEKFVQPTVGAIVKADSYSNTLVAAAAFNGKPVPAGAIAMYKYSYTDKKTKVKTDKVKYIYKAKTTKSYDIVLSAEAAKLVEAEIKAKHSIMLSSAKGLKVVKGKIEKAYLKTSKSGSSFQYYVISEAGMKEVL